MTNKRNTELQTRGWAPEELRVSKYQQTKKPQNPVAGVRFGILIFVMGFAGSLLGSLDAALGLGLLSGIGLYVFVVLLVVCISVVAVVAVLRQSKKRSAIT
ncbi:MAG: hypothetical protein NWF05_05150 [Candidatus Bathyarchaeota archaeon]|nr:hypothetical protein [Candidatus Bathyarchaeota archaeon]